MKSRYLACVLVLAACMTTGLGCKSDGADGGDGGTFLTVLQTAPQDRANDVPIRSRIGFQIDEPIDPSTLTSETFFVTDEDGASVAGTRTVLDDDPNAAEFVLDEPLSVITTYTVTVTTGLRSQRGVMLEEDFQWEFKTLDSSWKVSEWIEETVTGTSNRQEIVVDGQQNALAVWEFKQATGTGIRANRYTRIDLWGEPEAIDDGIGDAARPSLAADSAGNGIAVWERSEDQGLTARIWTNRYDVAQQAWGTAELLQSGEVTRAQLPVVAADPSGNAIAIWVQQDMTTGDQVIWARRFEASTGWGAAGPIGEAAPESLVRSTSLGMDDEGNAIAVWTRPTVMGDVLWSNRYTAGAGWGTAALIKADVNTTARNQRISVGRGGDAFVVWEQGDGTRDDIWAVRFSGSTWGEPERIDDYDVDNKMTPDIAVDGSGVAHAVWAQADADFDNIWSNRYTPGPGWGTPQLIEPPAADPEEDRNAANPRVDANSAGNTFVVWTQEWDNWSSIWSNRLDPDTGWMTAELIEDIARPGKSPKIVVDEERHAHALWLHYVDAGFDWVRTNRFE